MTTKTFKTPAIHCHHCAMTIKTELSDLVGVESVQVNVDEKTTEVTFDKPATETDVRSLLEEIGYPAEG
jgi:copper chaperone CopZ